MDDIGWAITEGITAFTATNVDDLMILLLFFAQVDETWRPHHVVVGAYAGFAILVALSLVGFFGGLVISPAWIGWLGLLPIYLGFKQLLTKESTEKSLLADKPKWTMPVYHPLPVLTWLNRWLAPQTYQVAVMTVANGGDNIGIYVPLFAVSNGLTLSVILGVFFLLKGVWCYVAYWLTQHPQVAEGLDRYGHRVVPFILIGLGCFILWKNGTLMG